MRFRSRLQMNMIPILLFTIVVVAAGIILILKDGTEKLQTDTMSYRLNVVREYASSEYESLQRINLLSSERYVSEAKARIFDFISETEFAGGHFRIVNSDIDPVYASSNENFRTDSKTGERLQYPEWKEDTLIKTRINGKNYLAMYEYFEPWDWFIVVFAEADVVYADIDRAVLLSIMVTAIALGISIISIHGISRSISKPVEHITKIALAMRDGEYNSRAVIERQDEIGALADAFNNMAEEIEGNFTQIRAKSESLSLLASFAAGMAHDLKTPIGNTTTVISFIDEELTKLNTAYYSGKLTKDKMEEFLADSKDGLSIIEKNIRQASELVSGYKTVSVDQLNRERRWINIHEYFDEVIHSLSPRIKKTGIQVLNYADPKISTWTYPGALSQIVTNLIVNSLVHGFEDGSEGLIEIHVFKKEDNIVIEYKDNGAGISSENIKFIYDAFFTTKHNQGGSGLGMHIIYNLVKSLLGGTVECESELGHGVKFTIVFPDASFIS